MPLRRIMVFELDFTIKKKYLINFEDGPSIDPLNN